MIELPLTKNQVTFIDDEDWKLVFNYTWHAFFHGNTCYARANIYNENGKRVTKYLHQFLLDVQEGQEIDHVNHNGLDNQKENLRICTHEQNMGNYKTEGNFGGKVRTSVYKGVSWHKKVGKWAAQINTQGTRKHLGYFDNEDDAAKTYNKAADEKYGEFAYLNKIVQTEVLA